MTKPYACCVFHVYCTCIVSLIVGNDSTQKRLEIQYVSNIYVLNLLTLQLISPLPESAQLIRGVLVSHSEVCFHLNGHSNTTLDIW